MGAVDVSLCVASYRRPDGLVRLLHSLAALKVPEGVRVEAIVVDNDPASDPAAPPASGIELPGWPLRVLREPRRGVAHARNRAVAAARGHWIALLDDDGIVDESWLAAHWDCLGERECDGLFGPVLPRLQAPVDPWLDPLIRYAGRRYRTGRRVTDQGLRAGNALVRRALFRDGGFDPEFAHGGGEDVAFFRGRVARGAHFEWCDEAIVHQVVPVACHRLGWLVRRAFRSGCVEARVQRRLRRAPARPAATARAAADTALLLAAALASLSGGRGRAARGLLRAVAQAGQGWAHLGGICAEYRD